MTFKLNGNPLPYREFKTVKGAWSDYKQELLRRVIDLENQMDSAGAQFIGTPVHIDFTFSFDVKKGRSRKATMKHTERPCLEDLIKYVNAVAGKKLYIPESVISITARKQWTENPGTEFTIKRV